MPHKGFFTQGLAILLRQAVPLKAIEECLGAFSVVKKAEAPGWWQISGPSLAVAYRPDVNGYVTIDTVDRPWPDGMGDQKAEPETFTSWSMGHFGPGTWPGSLERACQQSWAWPEGRTLPLQHRAFIRVRSSYAFGAGDDAPVMPEDYAPLPELEFATRLAAALVRLPEALCFFNPNGECVLDPAGFLGALEQNAAAKRSALDVWSNVRLFNADDTAPGWSVMDTVGMSQLDVSDHEAIFQPDVYQPGEVAAFLRNASDYVVRHGEVIGDDDTIDGPGDLSWQARNLSNAGVVAPPRDVIRWLPMDGGKPPSELLEAGTS